MKGKRGRALKGDDDDNDDAVVVPLNVDVAEFKKQKLAQGYQSLVKGVPAIVARFEKMVGPKDAKMEDMVDSLKIECE